MSSGSPHHQTRPPSVMTYRVTFTYDDQDYEFEDELDINELWGNAEIGHVELFEYAGADYPDDFDYDLFDGPYCQAQ